MARQLSAAQFDEVFRESTRTLSMEIANLKTIIARFSDFSKMPKPQLERIDARDAVKRVRALYEAAGQKSEANIRFNIELSAEPMPPDADPELLHRALSNLVLNAMDAMPEGGTLRSLRPAPRRSSADSHQRYWRGPHTRGRGSVSLLRFITADNKQHGTGLCLAIVQSVVADHAGTIAVESRPSGGAVFITTLPEASDLDGHQFLVLALVVCLEFRTFKREVYKGDRLSH